ncbi:bestrophin family protein [Coleofasciculus sp. F4-SAH-05]|jgi:putative membrane protein|uniref:bestrophin family protein n=1 Tax=Coleofasciculus TaxID=669368 RepID=UPI0032F92119
MNLKKSRKAANKNKIVLSALINDPDWQKNNWLRIALSVKGSVIIAILPRVILCSIFGLVISLFHEFGFSVSLPVLSGVVPSLVLGLLLVFRTNTAYERFWEGRKIWGMIVNTVRNLARHIWTAIAENSSEDKQAKEETLRLLVAFAVATKQHLRRERLHHELEPLMSAEQYQILQSMNHPPLEIAFWIGDYLQKQHERDYLNTYQLTAMVKLLDTLVDLLGMCERILKTPIPLAYSIHLKQLLLIYCLSLPFPMVNELNWLTGVVVGVISFAVFGIEEIGIEIENPFGYDTNDLPLETICTTMQHNIEDLIRLYPSVRYWKMTNNE